MWFTIVSPVSEYIMVISKNSWLTSFYIPFFFGGWEEQDSPSMRLFPTPNDHPIWNTVGS